MPTKNKQSGAADALWSTLSSAAKSMQNKPMAWLLWVWAVGWALLAWHLIQPASWDTVWGSITKTISPAHQVNRSREQASATSATAETWLHELGKWGQVGLYASTVLLALYVCYALWVWRQYRRVWMPGVRRERLRGGEVLEVIIPTGSKADARAAADMFGQIGKMLSDRARNGNSFRPRDMEAERLALSLEMWSTPGSGGKVGFYIWCPANAAGAQPHRQTGRNSRRGQGRQRGQRGQRGQGDRIAVSRSKGSRERFTEEIRHLIMVHHPRSRVRWVEDPLKKALGEITRANGGAGRPETGAEAENRARSERPVVMTWYELGLRADSRYPIGSGAGGARLSNGTRSLTRPGAPGAGSDPLAAILGMLGSDKTLPVVGLQIVAAAQPGRTAEVQQAVSRELAQLRELEAQAGRKALGPLHDARVLALEEKADRQGYDVAIRLTTVEVAVGPGSQVGEEEGEEEEEEYEAVDASRGAKSEARLASLARIFKQYDRTVAGVSQGFEIVRKEQVSLNALGTRAGSGSASSVDTLDTLETLRKLSPVLGRWPREGVCLPRLLPFVKMGRPAVLNTVELSSIYHFPHQGLEGLASLGWKNYRQISPPDMAHVTREQLAKKQHVVLGVLDDDLAPNDREILPGKIGRHYVPGSDTDPEDPDGAAKTDTQAGALTVANVLPPGTRGVGTYYEDLRRGTYVLGPMGSGKSVFLYNIITQYMKAGRGVGIIDGKGDSYQDVLQLVPPHLEGEVLTFDPENRAGGVRAASVGTGGGGSGRGPHRSGSGGGRSIGINPLDGRMAAQFGAEKVESLTMSLMRKMMGASWETAVLMQRYLRDAIIAVLQAEPSPTMLNLWRWLQDDGKGGNEYREAHMENISNKLVQDFWQRQVQGMSAQQRSSMQNVLTRVDRYVKNDVRYLLLQPYSTVNFKQIMDRGTIFVGNVSPRLGEDQSFLGAMVLNGFLTGAFARQTIPKEQRRDYLLVVDEFQNFVDTASADMERMLSMARGYRLGLMLAHQYTDQLPKEVLSAILKNVQTWAVFGLQAEDARRFASYMEGVEAQDFQNLPPYYTYQRTVVNNRATGVYSAAPLYPPAPASNPGEERARYAMTELRDRFVPQMPEREREEFAELGLGDAPGRLEKLVKGEREESKNARLGRIMRLATELYWPAEEGDQEAVRILSMLSSGDFELYRRARRNVLDKQERAYLLAHPQLIRDKAKRIERLSALRWGTPCAEVDALVLATLSGRAGGYSGKAETGAPGSSARSDVSSSWEEAAGRTEKLTLLPDFTDL